jgi:toxin ParE1/3/4
MDNYQISKAAELDISELYIQGILKHGIILADQYYDGLIEQFEFLAKNPDIGFNSNELAANLQRFPYGRHTIFFINIRTVVLIVRILGEEMDFKRHL